MYSPQCAPAAGRRGCSARRSRRASSSGRGVRHRQIAGQDVEERRDVGRALDRRVPAQRQDAAARAADVAEQQLDDRGGADVLHADRVLRPADRVAERRRALAARVVAQRLGHLEELLARDAADLLDHLRRVAGEVALEDLEDAARVLQRRVLVGRLAVRELAAVRAVRLLARVAAARVAGGGAATSMPSYCHVRRRRSCPFSASKPLNRPSRSSVSRKSSATIAGRVRVVHDVLAELALVLEDVVDERAEEGDVAAGADRHVQVGHRARAREPRDRRG